MGKKWKRLLVERRKVEKSAVVEAVITKPVKKTVVAPVIVKEAVPVVVDEIPVADVPAVEKTPKTKPSVSRKANSKVRRKNNKED